MPLPLSGIKFGRNWLWLSLKRWKSTFYMITLSYLLLKRPDWQCPNLLILFTSMSESLNGVQCCCITKEDNFDYFYAIEFPESRCQISNFEFIYFPEILRSWTSWRRFLRCNKYEYNCHPVIIIWSFIWIFRSNWSTYLFSENL